MINVDFYLDTHCGRGLRRFFPFFFFHFFSTLKLFSPYFFSLSFFSPYFFFTLPLLTPPHVLFCGSRLLLCVLGRLMAYLC